MTLKELESDAKTMEDYAYKIPKVMQNNFLSNDEPDDEFLSTQARNFLLAPDADPLPEVDVVVKDNMKEEPEYHNHIYWKVPIEEDDSLLNELLEDYD
eukprot:CAMPEP_0176398334 /NCGR_PEP_ID=MMETSP0126-20121128/45856_1 /TAXON_ID=141414 ORGANISM="Strombidinopsis acuminatum, Strain SPMC142" /NCGR_SAMPLE_ID=MMETSP0126 /ASSEMBLY_ACC=CAM_ASM_000229 /LENGTH=97 /DNA_ID=CAMNT_0017773211 /DNA_START=2758 /DNA_END=3051 /DNA_ORIENTATION=+